MIHKDRFVGTCGGRGKRAALSAGAVLLSGIAFPALAQPAPPPVFREVDQNGVELRTGGLVRVLATVGVGSGAGSVAHNWSTSQGAQTDALGYILEDTSVAINKTFSVVIGGSHEVRSYGSSSRELVGCSGVQHLLSKL